ncbi:MAG: GDP-L-fucose synthase [bacterium]|nr:GDP-L-fucose synthase [bacterium]
MKKDSLIYIAGHTGLIGSAITRGLKSLGYKNLILKTHNELDLINQKEVEKLFKKERPEYVFVCAGKTGGIYANMKYPADFIYQNLLISANLIHSSFLYKVKKLLYIGCSCMYPKFCKQPMKEEYLLTGALEPTSEPYAIAKIAGIKMCISYYRQYGSNFIPVIAGNIYGPGGSHFNEEAHVIPSLIRKFYEAKRNNEKSVTIGGTGKPTRDFLYVDDMADACIFLMRNLEGGEIYNIGTGTSVSISEIAHIIKSEIKYKGEIVFDISKPDGMLQRCLDITKIKNIGWKPKTQIKEGIKKTLQWFMR